MSRSWRLLTTVTLLGLTVGVTTLRLPARGGEGDKPAPAASVVRAANSPIIPPYVDDAMAGMIAFRPAATFRRMGSDLILPVLNVLGLDISEIPKLYKSVTSKPGSLKLGVEDVEWVTCGIRFGRTKNNQGDDVGTVYFWRIHGAHGRAV